MLVIMSIALGFVSTSAQTPTSKAVRAMIGAAIEDGEKSRTAALRDKLKPRDRLQVFVAPKNPGWVYLIHSDGTVAQRFEGSNAPRKLEEAGELTVFPNMTHHFAVDGKSLSETFCIVYTPSRLKDLEELFTKGKIPAKQWDRKLSSLKQRSQIRLGGPFGRPIVIASNVRGNEFLDLKTVAKHMKTYSGNEIVVQPIEFRVVSP